MIAGGLFDSDEMIQKAFEISIKTVNKNAITSKYARDILLIPKTKKINKNAFQAGKIGIQLLFILELI